MTTRQKQHPTLGDVVVISEIILLMGLFVREQLHLPKDQRTWHGTLFGIPYDFRCPTFERLHETFWNKMSFFPRKSKDFALISERGFSFLRLPNG